MAARLVRRCTCLLREAARLAPAVSPRRPAETPPGNPEAADFLSYLAQLPPPRSLVRVCGEGTGVYSLYWAPGGGAAHREGHPA